METINKTKIIATIGPATESVEMLRKLFKAGVDVCRLNFSHSDYDAHLKVINNINTINNEDGSFVAMLADLQGPKLRVGEMENNGVDLIDGKEIIFTTIKCIGTPERVYMTYPEFPLDVVVGDNILLDDGKLVLKAISTNKKDEVKAVVVHGGKLSSKKGVNLPSTKISLPCLTEKDLQDLKFALEHKVQWVALSFVRRASDIYEIKEIIKKYKCAHPPLIIAKIEKPEALTEIDEIIKATDGIMVARGDLGVELPIEKVPMIQKMLVKKCITAGKPVIVATQMMESMITNITPTRAEVTDVANAVLDGADAVMLSAETSVGKFPVEVIDVMEKIISQVENQDEIYYKHFCPLKTDTECFISESIAYHACNMAQQVDAKAIVAMSRTGTTAFKVASHRPKASIFIFTNSHTLLYNLNLVWGVTGYYYDKHTDIDHLIEYVKHKLLKEGHLVKGDLIINLVGIPILENSPTNSIKLSSI